MSLNTLAPRWAVRNTADEAPAAQSYLLQRVQPALTGLIDGSLSTLAPIFAVALATHQPHYAFLAGVATAIGAGVSMAFSEGLSDSGELTGRGNPYLRGAITGAGTVRRRDTAHAAILDPAIPSRPDYGHDHRSVGAAGPGLDSVTLL